MLGSGQDGENEGKGDFGPKMETYLMVSEEGEGVAYRAGGGVRQGGVFRLEKPSSSGRILQVVEIRGRGRQRFPKTPPGPKIE